VRSLYARVGLEAIVWIGAFIYLAVHDPYAQSEFTLCPLKNLGFHYCPGCGLGRSVSFLLHGDVVRSFETHILGIPATIIFFSRIISLLGKAVTKDPFTKLRSSHG
jgi:hypothetical protein